MRKIIILILSTLFIITSCTETNENKVDPEVSKMKTELANHAFTKALIKVKEKTETTENDERRIKNASDMNEFDFTNAYNLYNDAIEADPSNLDAQLGAAVSRILSLMKTPEFIILRNAWWNIADNHDLSSMSLNESRLKISNFINNALMPAIDYSLERMAVLDTDKNKNYVYLITPEFYDEEEGDTFELDMSEIKQFHAALIAVKSFISLSQSYKIDITDYSLEGIKNALTRGSDFLTLLDSSKMIDAHNKANDAINKSLEGIDFLLAETDDQDDDLLKNTANHTEDIHNFKDNLLKLQDALNNPYEIKNNGITLNLTISSFFNNAPQDLKALLPDYTVEIENNELKIELVADNKVDMIYPDTTFGGLLQGTPSQEDIKLFTEIYECISSESCNEMGETDYYCNDEFNCKYGPTCSADTECESYQHCSADGHCLSGIRCNNNTDCNEWQHCSTENICEYGTPCSSNTDCYSDETCNEENYCEWIND